MRKLLHAFAALGQPIGRLSLKGGPAYAFALCMVALAAGVRAALPEALGSRVPFPTFFLAVFISAWVGGWRAGLFASGLTLVAGATIFPITRPPWDWRDAVALAFVFSVCAFATHVSARLRESSDLLDQGRQWYQRILDRVGDAVLVSDEAGRLRYFNRHASGLWNIQPDQLGQPVSEVVSFRWETTHERFDLEPLLHDPGQLRELPAGLEVQVGTRSIPVTGNVSCYSDPDYGRGAVIAVQSILALREVGRRVELSERRLRALFDSGMVGVFTIDEAGLVTETNAEMLRILGREPSQEATPRTVGEFASGDVVRRILSAGDQVPRQDLPLRRGDGQEAWVSLGSVAISARERIVLALGIGERRQAEEEASETRKLLQILIDQVPALVAFVSRDGRMLLANRHFRDATGHAGADEPWWSHLDPCVSRAITPHLGKVLGGTPVEFIVQAPGTDPGPREFQVHLVPYMRGDPLRDGVVVYAYDVTEPLQRERILASSEARFRRLAEASAAVVWQSRADGEIEVQFGWQEFTGRAVPACIGDWAAEVHPDDRDTIDRLVQALRGGHSGFEVEFRLRHAKGEFRRVAARAVMLGSGQGKPQWIGTIRDIHQRWVAEAALAAKEKDLRLILDSVPARIAYLDPGGNFQWANRSFADWYAGSEDVRGRRVDTLMSEQGVAAMRTALHQARNGLIGQVEWLEENPMMGRRWTTTTLSPDLDEHGDVRGVISLCVDSTHRHETEDALRRSDAEHRTLAENVPHLVWMAGPDGRVEYGNSRWMDYTGNALGDDWQESLHPEDRGRACAAMAQASEHNAELSLEVRVCRKRDGFYRWHLLRALPLAEPDGSLLRWYGSCTDIDDQKAAEVTLREAHTRMTQFLATLSHELRNPLAALSASAQVLQNRRAGETMRSQAAQGIGRQTLHLKRLTDDLLDVARITLGKIQISSEAIDLCEVCRNVCHDFSAKARRGSVSVNCHVPDGPVMILGDPARVRQCLDNLVSNALKASAAGMVVSISLSTRDGMAEILVADEGVGIDPSEQPGLFLPFSQGATWQNQGLGLGLSIVSRLVQLHGGEVKAHSPGRNLGSTFTLLLPTMSPGVDAETPRDAPVALPDTVGTTTVLVVDDERDNATALANCLSLEGHLAYLAEDGIEAITLADRHRPKVVICDLGLPAPLHGYEVATRLREQFGGAMYLCAYSGYGSRTDIERSLAAGFDEHVTKPASPREILAVVQRGLDRLACR